MIRNFTLLFALLLIFPVSVLMAQNQAEYTITFNSTWNETDHGTLPPTAHWSDLVGATHNSNVKFWEFGQLATAGIEDVAELGNNVNFNTEVNTAIGNSDADQWLQAAFSPFAAISSATLSGIVVSSDYPLLTLAAMVAPSPDWFVGVDSFSFLDMGGNWKTSVVIDMFVYDAGTEEGTGYSLSNPDTVPAVPIFSRVNMTPFNDQKIGTLTISLDQVLSSEEPDFENSIRITPNPASSVIRILNSSTEAIRIIEIFNMVGERVNAVEVEQGTGTIEINPDQLSSGIYLLRMVSEENRVLSRKLILN